MLTTWATPKYFFDHVNKDFGCTLDVCAEPETAKVSNYYTKEIDGLKQDWSNDVFWMNPPYGRGQNVYQWVEKAYLSAINGGTGVVLLPLSGDTKWFHDFVMKSSEIWFVKDRIWFEIDGVGARANHASIIVIFRPCMVNSLAPKIKTITNCRVKPIKIKKEAYK